jgi:stage II sporulation protein P
VTPGSNSDGTQQTSGENISALDNIISRNIITGNTYTKEQLSNYAFTKGFYTVASATSLTSSILKPAEFLEKDMAVAHNSDSPQILLFHTHSQEGFADSVEGDDTTTILGVGDYLAKILTEKYGYNVIHDRSIYDYVDGKLDRSKAYTYAENGIAAILKNNPSIDVVIDLHRDGVAESTRLVTQIDGKQMAKVMLFNGISYSNAVGNISYLSNPYRDDNLAMSLQLQLLGEAYYPGFLRNIYINAYRYCLNQRAKSMLIEAGAQTNTFEEVKNSMEPLADLLDKLLRGEKAY